MNILWIPMPWNSLVQDRRSKRKEVKYIEDEFFINFFASYLSCKEEIGVVLTLKDFDVESLLCGVVV